MRRLLLLVPIVLALVLPAQASAGGFATAGLSSTPEGLAPGEPWKVDITVLQHGRTPLDGLTPRVRISSGDTTRDFVARAGRRAGRVPGRGRVPLRRALGLRGARRLHRRDAAHVPGGPDRRARRRSPAAPEPDDGGIATGWLLGAGAALVLAAAVLLARPPAPAAGASCRGRRSPREAGRRPRGGADGRGGGHGRRRLRGRRRPGARAAGDAPPSRPRPPRRPPGSRCGPPRAAAAATRSRRPTATARSGPTWRADAAQDAGRPTSRSRSSHRTPRSRRATARATMPEDYAQRISPADLDRLVTFLVDSAAG